jgi:hypothetical protein
MTKFACWPHLKVKVNFDCWSGFKAIVKFNCCSDFNVNEWTLTVGRISKILTYFDYWPKKATIKSKFSHTNPLISKFFYPIPNLKPKKITSSYTSHSFNSQKLHFLTRKQIHYLLKMCAIRKLFEGNKLAFFPWRRSTVLFVLRFYELRSA